MPQPAPRVARALWMAYLCAVAAPSAQAADCLRPQDDFFLISTRNLCSAFGTRLDWQRLICRQYVAIAGDTRRGWIDVPIDAFYASDDPSQLTLLYVHGNRVEPGEDIVDTLSAYRALVECTPNLPPIRLVAFAWPASRIRGLAKDVHLKAQLADPAGLHLAWVLSRLRSDVPLALVGYSYGARVITGGLHVVEGGTLCGYGLPARANLGNVHVLLIAAAVHRDWVFPGQPHGLALGAIDRLVLVNNPCDPAMRLYHMLGRHRLLRRHRRLSALGQFGLPYSAAAGRIAGGVYQFDACSAVGKRHAQEYYFSARLLMRQAAQPLLHFETTHLSSLSTK